MSALFKNKYRVSSARLQHWDYGSNAAYFITICIKNREQLFGQIVEGKMQLNELGILANRYWQEIPQHFNFVALGNFVVMPNHFHGIIIINKTEIEPLNVETRQCLVSTNETNEPNKTFGQMRFQNQGKNTLSSIVGSYKSAVTKKARKINNEFNWQSRFHDHIIRDAQSFENIQNYIETNPLNWEKDMFYKNE